jgi:hypothetical protein
MQNSVLQHKQNRFKAIKDQETIFSNFSALPVSFKNTAAAPRRGIATLARRAVPPLACRHIARNVPLEEK